MSEVGFRRSMAADPSLLAQTRGQKRKTNAQTKPKAHGKGKSAGGKQAQDGRASPGSLAKQQIAAMLPIQKGSQEEKMALIALMMVRKIKKQMRSASKSKKRRRGPAEQTVGRLGLLDTAACKDVEGGERRISPTDVSSIFEAMGATAVNAN